MAFKIYTKTGDEGETGLFGGTRLPKHHLRIDAYGTVDELNAHLGVVRDALTEELSKAALKAVQDRLFSVGAYLATAPGKDLMPLDLEQADLLFLESEIDRMEALLPPLRNFILPGGHMAVSCCHVARCVCRRAERLVVALSGTDPVDPLVLQYMNRLSDYLFVLSRYIAREKGVAEIIWKPR
ncbi:MAG: hypothetical protein RLY31_2724 [Bacteroidota bacterium]|jgi:cob(I)alamin adenosyltransferase